MLTVAYPYFANLEDCGSVIRVKAKSRQLIGTASVEVLSTFRCGSHGARSECHPIRKEYVNPPFFAYLLWSNNMSGPASQDQICKTPRLVPAVHQN